MSDPMNNPEGMFQTTFDSTDGRISHEPSKPRKLRGPDKKPRKLRGTYKSRASKPPKPGEWALLKKGLTEEENRAEQEKRVKENITKIEEWINGIEQGLKIYNDGAGYVEKDKEGEIKLDESGNMIINKEISQKNIHSVWYSKHRYIFKKQIICSDECNIKTISGIINIYYQLLITANSSNPREFPSLTAEQSKWKQFFADVGTLPPQTEKQRTRYNELRSKKLNEKKHDLSPAAKKAKMSDAENSSENNLKIPILLCSSSGESDQESNSPGNTDDELFHKNHHSSPSTNILGAAMQKSGMSTDSEEVLSDKEMPGSPNPSATNPLLLTASVHQNGYLCDDLLLDSQICCSTIVENQVLIPDTALEKCEHGRKEEYCLECRVAGL